MCTTSQIYSNNSSLANQDLLSAMRHSMPSVTKLDELAARKEYALIIEDENLFCLLFAREIIKCSPMSHIHLKIFMVEDRLEFQGPDHLVNKLKIMIEKFRKYFMDAQGHGESVFFPIEIIKNIYLSNPTDLAIDLYQIELNNMNELCPSAIFYNYLALALPNVAAQLDLSLVDLKLSQKVRYSEISMEDQLEFLGYKITRNKLPSTLENKMSLADSFKARL